MNDRYANRTSGLDFPAAHGFDILPDDRPSLPEVTRALYVGSVGTLVVQLALGAEIVLSGVGSGTVLPVRATLVKASGMTAGAIVGLV